MSKIDIHMVAMSSTFVFIEGLVDLLLIVKTVYF